MTADVPTASEDKPIATEGEKPTRQEPPTGPPSKPTAQQARAKAKHRKHKWKYDCFERTGLIINILLCGATWVAAGFAGYAAIVFSQQLGAMHDEQRAWITVEDIKILPADERNEPNFIDPKKAVFPVHFFLRNVGRRPAYVYVVTGISLKGGGDWKKVQKTVCATKDAIKKNRLAALPFMVFPELQPFPYRPNPLPQANEENLAGKKPYVVGCVFYRMNDDADIYQTPFVANISYGQAERDHGRPFPADGKPIQADHLAIIDLSLAGEAK